jgi:hypothetical protein
VSRPAEFFGAGSAHSASFASASRARHSQPLFSAAFLPKGERWSSPLASSALLRAAPRLAVAGGQPVTAALQPFGLSAGIEAAIGAASLSKGRTMSAQSRTDRIRELNDAFRITLEGGKCLFTPGVSDMGVPFATAALAIVKAFKEFTSDNDPYGEHDFGAFEIGEERLFWKIDYYDTTLRFGSKDPADPAQTKRVLTIMLVEEY